MQDVSNQIKELIQKSSKLLEDYTALKAKYHLLQEDFNSSKQTILEKEQHIQKIEKEYNLLKLSKKVSSDDNREDVDKLKKQLDLYIKELDRCIHSLNAE